MPTLGVSDALTASTTDLLGVTDSISTSLMDGETIDAATIGDLTASGTNLLGTGVAEVNPDLGDVISNQAQVVSGATVAAVDGDLATALDLSNDAIADVATKIVDDAV